MDLNSVLVPKIFSIFLWKNHKVSQYFEDISIGKSVPLSSERQKSFSVVNSF